MGHSPSEAFNETVEEATQSLIPSSGIMAWTGCSAHAARRRNAGALDWSRRFEAHETALRATLPRCQRGVETQRFSIHAAPDYREKLQKELDEWKNQKCGSGAMVRSFDPRTNEMLNDAREGDSNDNVC